MKSSKGQAGLSDPAIQGFGFTLGAGVVGAGVVGAGDAVAVAVGAATVGDSDGDARLVLLTERQRAIFVAHYYLGLSQEEIAQALGIRRGTVSATVSQSLARMRQGDAKSG